MYENDNDNFSWGTETSGNENLFYDTSSPKKWLLGNNEHFVKTDSIND